MPYNDRLEHESPPRRSASSRPSEGCFNLKADATSFASPSAASLARNKPVVDYNIRKSELSLEAFFSRPAFDLLKPKTQLHEAIATHLSDFLPLRGSDIRIDTNTNPLSSATVTYELRPFNGVARISVDRAQLAFFSPHTLETAQMVGLSLVLLRALDSEISNNKYDTFVIQAIFHAELSGTSPVEHTSHYISSTPESYDCPIGGSVTYYFGQHGARTHSSVTLDMSGDFSECIFVRISIGFDGEKIPADELSASTLGHISELLTLIGLGSNL